jgi:predicted TIM-barrel fold metal-dependent hydrolase
MCTITSVEMSRGLCRDLGHCFVRWNNLAVKSVSSSHSTRSRLAKRFQLQTITSRQLLRHPDAFVGFTRTDPTHPLAVNEIRRAVKKSGLKGLELHPRSQLFRPSDEGMAPILEACVALSVPILFHSGFAYEPIPPKIAEVAERFPELPLIVGHMGCSEACKSTGVEEAVQVARASDNVYLETSRVMLTSCKKRFGSLGIHG